MSSLRALLATAFIASRALGQHMGHEHGAPESPARFAFQAALIRADDNTSRGGRRLVLRDWEHVESPALLGGRVRLIGMTSLGTLVDRQEIPSLLQTGGVDATGYIHDRQHPDDLVMEAAARLDQGPLFAYVAAVGEPALGPESWMHRSSSSADPMAPIGHHWQDATHTSYGVTTIGARGRHAELAASAFNARESDLKDGWPDFRGARLDSYAARATAGFAQGAISAWYGYITHHDVIYPSMPMHRYGASASVKRSGLRGGAWSSLAVWGMNVHHHDSASHVHVHGDTTMSPHMRSSSLLLESTLGVGMRHDLFVRLERVMKTGEELGFIGDADRMTLFDIRQVAIGGRRDIAMSRFGTLAGGARVAASFLPQSLEFTYGTRRPLALDLFVQARSSGRSK
jgi:hypothetical protein